MLIFIALDKKIEFLIAMLNLDVGYLENYLKTVA